MDSWEWTKIGGAITGIGAVALGLSLLAGGYFGFTKHHDPEHPPKLAYALDIPEPVVAGAEAEPEIPFSELLASANLARGEQLFKRCQSCHQMGAHGLGPDLTGIVGRIAGQAEGFGQYSSAMKEYAAEWTVENLNAFFEAPADYIDGTTMNFRGIRKPEDRAHLIAWLQTQ